MEWNRSIVVPLARTKCAHCHGEGLRPGRKPGSTYPCGCVRRAVFRACYARFRDCVEMEKRLSTVSLDWSSSSNGRRFYGRKVEEYIADFCLISRRSLKDSLYEIFRYYFVL